MKIGSAERFIPEKKVEDGPGAIYNPGFPMHTPNLPKYSFGKPPETKKGRKVEANSTPVNVGPNSYFRDGYPDNHVHSTQPIHRFPKKTRFIEMIQRGQSNQTFED
jgi:hypothetical protein